MTPALAQRLRGMSSLLAAQPLLPIMLVPLKSSVMDTPTSPGQSIAVALMVRTRWNESHVACNVLYSQSPIPKRYAIPYTPAQHVHWLSPTRSSVSNSSSFSPALATDRQSIAALQQPFPPVDSCIMMMTPPPPLPSLSPCNSDGMQWNPSTPL